MARDQKLYDTCKEWMQKQDKLELFRDYNDYLDDDQVKKFISYVEDRIEQWDILEPEDYLYDWFTEQWWFNDYENDWFYDKFMKPFEEQYGEEEWFDYNEAYEILRDLMYEMDLYDSDIKHFDKKYNFYLLTDPERTLTIYDYPYSIAFKWKYFNSLKRSQWWTDNCSSMRTLFDWAYDYLWICIHINYYLFDFINILKAKRLTVKKWSAVYFFEPFNWSWWCETELTSDWSFNLKLKEIWFWVDWARRWPRGYVPEEVYWWVHSYFDKNIITFKSLRW